MATIDPLSTWLYDIDPRFIEVIFKEIAENNTTIVDRLFRYANDSHTRRLENVLYLVDWPNMLSEIDRETLGIAHKALNKVL